MDIQETTRKIFAIILEEVNGFTREEAEARAEVSLCKEAWDRVVQLLKDTVPRSVRSIAAERVRQIKEEGYSVEQDAQHYLDGELAEAASCYAAYAQSIQVPINGVFSLNDSVHKIAASLIGTDAMMLVPKTHRWPWSKQHYKPTPDNRRRELKKAGALIAAEIDRLDYIEEYGEM